jgi:hypothetical protein
MFFVVELLELILCEFYMQKYLPKMALPGYVGDKCMVIIKLKRKIHTLIF